MSRKLRMGMVGGGPGAFIGPVHRMAAELDGRIPIRKHAPVELHDRPRQVNRRWLFPDDIACTHPSAAPGSAGGIHDGAPNLGQRFSLPHGLRMTRARPMAPLAIDPFRHRRREHAGPVYLRMSAWNRRVSIMAEHAPVRYMAAESRMLRAVVSGAHAPVASMLRIPAHGQFDQPVVARAVQVGDGMVSRTNCAFDGDFP